MKLYLCKLTAYICKSLPVISIQKTNIFTFIGMEAIAILKDRIKKRKVPNICVVQMTVVVGTSWTASKHYTGCSTKNYTLFWRAVAPLDFELGIKVGGVLESSGSQLFKTVPTFDF